MPAQDFANGAAQASGAQLANAVLNTPQGKAVLAGTAATAVAIAPAAAVGFAAVATVIAVGSLWDWAKRNW